MHEWQVNTDIMASMLVSMLGSSTTAFCLNETGNAVGEISETEPYINRL